MRKPRRPGIVRFTMSLLGRPCAAKPGGSPARSQAGSGCWKADYQRPYAWERKQLDDLWEDLDLLGPIGTHFAGTLVLRTVMLPGGTINESMSDDGTSLQHCEVVNGQQRLTTCFVLLDRVRRRLLGLEQEGLDVAGMVARKIRDTYGLVSVENAFVPKLRLGSGLNDYW